MSLKTTPLSKLIHFVGNFGCCVIVESALLVLTPFPLPTILLYHCYGLLLALLLLLLLLTYLPTYKGSECISCVGFFPFTQSVSQALFE